MQSETNPPAPRRRLTIDGVRPKAGGVRQSAHRAPVAKSKPVAPVTARPTPPAAPARPHALPPVPEKTGGFWRSLQTPAIIFGGMIAGFGMQSLSFGLVAIGLYGIAALVFKLYSRTTFTLALISLIAVPIILVARQNTEVASNFATYTFLLIVIGIISLLRESPQSGRRYLHNKKRTT